MRNDNPGFVIDITANIAKLEKALEEKFKPALAKAINDVVASFMAEDIGDCVEIGELKATALGQYRSMGALTGNEVRAMLNIPPREVSE